MYIKSAPLLVCVAVSLVLVGCASHVDNSGSALPSAERLSDAEYAQALASCLQGKGWDVVVDQKDDSVYTPNGIPEDQSSEYDNDVETCSTPLEPDMPTLEEMTASQWHEWYEREEQAAQCLRDQGVEVQQMPSEATYVDRYKSGDPWLAYDAVGDVDESTWLALNEACPQPRG